MFSIPCLSPKHRYEPDSTHNLEVYSTVLNHCVINTSKGLGEKDPGEV